MHPLPRFAMLSVIVWLFSINSCFASDPNGTWTSSSGSTVQVWANMQQLSITLTSPQGQQSKFNGWWTRFSDYFSYQGPDGIFNASFNGPNQIKVQAPNGTLYLWNRGQYSAPKAPQYSPPPQLSVVDISGLWSSSSGSSVQVSSQGNQVFITLVDRAGRRYQGSGRWLKVGQSFDYSIPGFPGVAYGTVVNQNQINVSYGPTPTVWYRQ